MVYLKSVENVITLDKLIGLLFLFCLPLLSILFFKTKRNDLARPVMGTIFLVGRAKRAPHWGVQSRFRVIYVIVIPWLRGIIVDNCPDSRGRSPSERAVSVR